MSSQFTIGHLASRTGLATSAIRYYERLGLIKPPGRTASGYRLYDESSVERLRFIRQAHSAGFTLEDIKALIRFQDGATTACGKVRTVIENRLDDVQRQLSNLEGVRQMLNTFLDACLKVERGEPCPVLDGLTSSARRAATRRQRGQGKR